MRRTCILVSGSLALILAGSLLTGPAQAQILTLGDNYFDNFNRRASGVPDPPPLFLLFNVYREGHFSASAQVQGTTLSGFAFHDDQGIWKRTGDREITARLLSFNFLPPGTDTPGVETTGAPHSNGVADVEMEISEDFLSLSGTFSITIYPLDVNPLAPGAEPIAPPRRTSNRPVGR